jgi:hypothetical protein
MGKKEIYSAGKTTLMCLYLHVREYIVKYISEIKICISVTTLVCLFIHSLCIFVQNFEQGEVLASLQIRTFCMYDILYGIRITIWLF